MHSASALSLVMIVTMVRMRAAFLHAGNANWSLMLYNREMMNVQSDRAIKVTCKVNVQ